MTSDSEDGDIGTDLFREPEGYYEPEKEPTFATHKLSSGQELTVRLVGHNPLWGHLLWQAGLTISTYLETHHALVQSRSVLELGAGGGLPSLVAGITGASKVVVTDYPDAELIDNLRYNIAQCSALPRTDGEAPVVAEGYLWGSDAGKLLAHLPKQDGDAEKGFNTLILADLLFNHSEHASLLRTVQSTLLRHPASVALVFFTPYRPWLLEKDLAFFDLAWEGGLTVKKVLEKEMEKVMFENDRGDEKLRRTVFGYELRWAEEELGKGK